MQESDKPKILFILPHYKPLSTYMRLGRWAPQITFFPLSIPILAALTPERDFSMEFVNEYWDESVDYQKDVDIVALTCLTSSAPRAYEIAEQFRRRGKLVVLGGVHASYCLEEARRHADVVCVGEGEETWPEFLQDFLANKVQPVYQAPRLVPPGLIPQPDRAIAKRNRKLSNISVMATRGCPYTCDFCTVSKFMGQGVRCRPVECVIEEIKEALSLENHKPPYVFFKDDNIAVHQEYARHLFERLLPLKIKWIAQTNIKSISDPNMVDLMARSGCVLIFTGLEAVHRSHITRFGKSYEEAGRIREVITMLHKNNILVHASFIFGFDDETTASLDHTLEHIRYVGLDSVMFNILTPFPGTALHDRFSAEGRITERRWEFYDGEHAVFIPRLMTSAELANLRKAAMRRFYSGGEFLRRLARAGGRIGEHGGWSHFRNVLILNVAGKTLAKRL